MLITALTIDDYEGVRHVRITPAADSYLILIAGRNKQGKTSTLNAISAALGGAKAVAADPVRHGAKLASIKIELDGGALIVERTIEPGGPPQLVVRDADGPVRRPQQLLDRLLGARFLDPLAFLRLPQGDQRAALMRIIPGAAEIQQLDERRERTFRLRTETGRKLAMASGEMQRLPPAAEPLTPIDVAALVAENARFAQQQRAGDGLGNVVALAEAKLRAAEEQATKTSDRIAALERELAETRIALGGWEGAIAGHTEQLEHARQQLAAAASAWASSAPRRADVEQLLANAGEHNRRAVEIAGSNARRDETQRAVDKLGAEVDKLTEAIAGIDNRKAQILADAQLPVDGLELADDGILVAGVPFAQAAASDQIRVALALAIAGSAGLDDICVRDGALLDDESLKLIAEHAERAGKRLWVERVGTADPGAIVIQDGQIAGAP